MVNSSKLARASLWMMLSTGTLNLCMMLYHRQMSSKLGLGYAQLSVLIGIINLFGVFTSGFSTYFAKTFARDAALAGSGAVRRRLRSLSGRLSLLILAFGALILAVGPWIVDYLKLNSFWLYALATCLTLMAIVTAVTRSAIQGLHRFGALGNSIILEGLGRVGLAVWMVRQGWGVFGALGGSLLGLGVGFLGCLPGLRGMEPAKALPPARRGQERFRDKLRELAKDTAALGLFSLLCFLDLFIFKHYHTEAEAALYSRAALVAKSFLYAAAAFNIVVLPMAAAAHAKGKDPRPILMRFLGLMGAVELAGLVFVWSFTPFTVGLLCGSDPQYLTLVPLIRWFCAAVVPLALYQLILLYQLSLSLPGALPFESLVALLYGVGLLLFHERPGQVVACLAAAACSACLGGLLLSLQKPPKHPGLNQEEQMAMWLKEGERD